MRFYFQQVPPCFGEWGLTMGFFFLRRSLVGWVDWNLKLRVFNILFKGIQFGLKGLKWWERGLIGLG